METKHTPGPWELVSLSGYGSPFSIRMPYIETRASAGQTYYGVQSIRRREDARLIAAAPDSFEVIRDLVRFVDLFKGSMSESQSEAMFELYRRARAIYFKVDPEAHDADRAKIIARATGADQ